MSSMHFENVPVIVPADNGSHLLVKKLQKFIEDKRNIKFDDFWSFQKWSTDNLQNYWEDLWDFSGIISAKKYDEVLSPNLPIHETRAWFKGAIVNYAENLLKYRDNREAIVTTGEDREPKRITYSQLYEQVELYVAAFRKCGLKKGDIVACYMSNRAEAFFAMIASASIGAIFTGALPLLGPEAVLSRIDQVKPKFLITVDRYLLEGKEIEMLPKVKVISEAISFNKVIVVPSRGQTNLPDISGIANSCFLDDFLDLGRGKDGSVPPIQFEYVSPSHPVFICFTSGTTGAPKPILHGFGALLAITNCFNISYDAGESSTWLSMSPVGWASWNMFASLLFIGAKIVLFESSPYFLSRTFFWDFIDNMEISHIIVPPSVMDEFKKREILPSEKHQFKFLKCFLSGGSVVKPETFDFYYEKVGKGIYGAIYGCTETMGMTLTMDFTLPLRRGELSTMNLGTALDTVDDEGNPVVGEMGHIVLTKSTPGLFLGIMGDEDGSIMREKYFSKFPGKFDAGDFAIINPITKGWYICGRSDDTLKQRGCRFGSSEIYRVVDKFPEVLDVLCVSKYNKAMDESAVLFVKMCPGHPFDEDLVGRIRKAISTALTVRHVPDFILETKDIPYNMNGKKMEIIVKNIINNRPFNASNIKNANSLNYFKDRPEFKDF